MLNKKIQAEAVKRRETAESEKQVQLRAAIQSKFGNREFGNRVQLLPNHAWHEYGLTISVPADSMRDIFQELRNDKALLFNMLMDVTAVDWLDQRENRFEVVYQLLSLTHQHRLCVKIQVAEAKPEVESLRSLWQSANFLEREVWDMFGINFKGHGDLRRILMYDEFVGHPLRKDYPIRGKQPRIPLRIPELRNTSDDMNREELVALPVRRNKTLCI